MQHLIIGYGEIGKAVQKVFNCDYKDKQDKELKESYDILHICIHYGVKFETIVESYRKKFNAKYVVVHSTVPVGTCEKLGVLHSPVTGVHPHLYKSLKTFTKFISGKDAEVVAEEFEKYGIKTSISSDSSNTEAGKLFGLLIYGINVLLEKEVYAYCEKNNLDYDVVYTQFVKMYNNGYAKMNMKHIKMYELKHQPSGIGGHCVMENSPLLNTPFSKFLDDYNTKFVV